MKVLVSSMGETLESEVDPRFGRAGFFAVVDTDTGALTAVSNAGGREAAQGAGIKAAEIASRHGVKVVLTGHCGPNAFGALKAAGITVMTGASGTVAEAVAAFKAGKLAASNSADVRGHWA
ncbi:MAG: NifB/NifX family molybdenum-iron cluster-binding protein [Planctomycetes bacterium]|jgi:predicted Fe-Mo cluster-binding NifX family protein|nr:NifB/NifX family molybdenum-iron cluster-binding protein [Planctomycetota bacterium]